MGVKALKKFLESLENKGMKTLQQQHRTRQVLLDQIRKQLISTELEKFRLMLERDRQRVIKALSMEEGENGEAGEFENGKGKN